ncbi:Rhodanese-related sulfurtransferase [Dokdonella koreensis DS-123]|uniref:Rhodanese-related sulfurtransferase n=1 Tax=Dokdonella koreensis DS-123 TaxID=1300342 RepID=A0A160DVZ9_9GAMM|nr:sulfurtransferase [Dokdonella koreensis]ANB18757.1 Rhodanese-related sulfurtransferase [Dokdonella koreensis DS-123]
MTQPIIDGPALAARLAAGPLLLVDARFDLADPARGAAEHAQARLPGAVHADLDRDLSDHSRPGLGRHPLPTAEAFSAVLARWGWRPGLPVVAYDDAGGALAAARLWWLLRTAGITDAAVLDGGFGAWRAAGLPLESGEVAAAPAGEVALRFDAQATIGYAELQAALATGSVVLLDARAAPRYRGEVEPIDPVAGHVPGARNRPFSDNLDAAGRFKPPAVLAAEFTALTEARPPAEVVHMCGSGVTACHNLLAMAHAGLPGSRLFAPSWSGWVGDRSRPVATGA